MLPGFDTAATIPYYLVREWLTRLRHHAYDRAWLENRAGVIARILSVALSRGEFMAEATDALIIIAPFMLTHHEVGRWLELLTVALGGAYDQHDAELQGRLYALMGQAHILHGNLKPARTLYEMAIEHAGDINDRSLADEIRLISYIGLFKTQTYRYTDDFSPELVAEVRALARKIDQDVLTAHLNQALATVYAHRGETSLALGYAMTALGCWYQHRDQLEISKSAQALAIAYSRGGLLTQAEQIAGIAYDHVLRANNPQYKANIVFQRGIIASQQEQWAQAREWLESAYAQFCDLGWQTQIALVCRSLALTYIPQKAFDEAELKLQHAALIWERERNEFESASVMATRAYLEAERGELERALNLYVSALTLCKRIPEKATRELLRQSISADIERYSSQLAVR